MAAFLTENCPNCDCGLRRIIHFHRFLATTKTSLTSRVSRRMDFQIFPRLNYLIAICYHLLFQPNYTHFFIFTVSSHLSFPLIRTSILFRPKFPYLRASPTSLGFFRINVHRSTFQIWYVDDLTHRGPSKILFYCVWLFDDCTLNPQSPRTFLPCSLLYKLQQPISLLENLHHHRIAFI
jgi:hypothetical protein